MNWFILFGAFTFYLLARFFIEFSSLDNGGDIIVTTLGVLFWTNTWIGFIKNKGFECSDYEKIKHLIIPVIMSTCIFPLYKLLENSNIDTISCLFMSFMYAQSIVSLRKVEKV